MRRIAIAAALALMGAAAFAQDVKTDYDKSANFGAIKTFQVKIGTSWGNPISEKRISEEFTQELSAKGLSTQHIKGGKRLIKAEQFRLDRHRAGKAHFLAHTPR